MTTTTAKYGWQMPDPGGSANTWGNTLNATTQAIDQQVYTNAQAGVQIGTVTMFAGATPPTNWLTCDGSSLATTGTYAALFAVIQYTYGGSGANFNLPNLQGKFLLGAGPNNALGSAGGSFTYTIGTGNLPAHAHPIVDVAHNHGVNQWAHSHGDGGGHAHSASQDPHSHTVSNVALGSGVNIQPGSGFNQTGTLPTSTAQPNVYVGAAHVSLDTQTSGISLNASGTGLSTTQNVGSGAPISIVPSYVAINFIIKYQ